MIRERFADFPNIFFISAKESIGLIPLMEHLREQYDAFLMERQQWVKKRQFEFV